MSPEEWQKKLQERSREEWLRAMATPLPDDWTYMSEQDLCEQLEVATQELEAVAPILYEPENGERIRRVKHEVLRQGLS